MAAASARVTVAGISYDSALLKQILEFYSWTENDLEKLLGPSASWPTPAAKTGWKLAHDCIRFDMDSFVKATDKTIALLNSGQALEAWQIEAFRICANDFYNTVISHHNHEEDIFFPWMKERVTLPVKMSADHKALVALLDAVRDACDKLAPADAATAKPSVEKLSARFSQLRSLMLQHLEEEEAIALPLLRKYFTEREAEEPEKRIRASLKPADLAWFTRRLDMAEKREAMRHMGIPGLVQRLVMLPAIRKDDRTVGQSYRDLAAGRRLQAGQVPQGPEGCKEKVGKERPGLLCCFAAVRGPA